MQSTQYTSAAPCANITQLLGAHLDGQLDAATTVEVDEHLGRCEACRERVNVDRSVRASLKRTSTVTAPADLRARALAAMMQVADERESQVEAPAAKPARTPMLRQWKVMLPLASAAAFALAWGAVGRHNMHLASSSLRHSMSNDDLVADFVDVHRHPLRPETPDPQQVRAFEREVGVPIRVPRLATNAKFIGGRLLPVRGGEHAAMLQYEVPRTSGVERVSVFVYDPRRVQLHAAEQLTPRAVGSKQIKVGRANGYAVAVANRDDVGYAVTSDLDDSSAEYALAADAD